MKAALSISVIVAAASCSLPAAAQTSSFTFSATGVSGSLVLSYGAATDAKYPQALEITGISGSFSDSNNGLSIVNAPILGLVPINHAAPEATNLLAPNDFSKFAVASGLEHGTLSYDNLFWPGGSPQTASDFPFSGGVLDIYGVLFDLGGGKVVNIWSNGNFSGTGPGPVNYGVAVATADRALDYVSAGVAVTAVPEPSSYALMLVGLGALGSLVRRRQRS